jgi:hypothetical protein
MATIPTGSTEIDVIPADTVPGHIVRLAFGAFLVQLLPEQAAQLGSLLLQAAGCATEKTRAAAVVASFAKLIV